MKLSQTLASHPTFRQGKRLAQEHAVERQIRCAADSIFIFCHWATSKTLWANEFSTFTYSTFCFCLSLTMSLTLCWWFAFLCLLQSVSAQSTGTIHFFTSSSCEGSHLSCSNIPSNGCCTTDGDLFASSYLVTFRGESS